MGKFKDLAGQKFCRLTVLYRLYNNHKSDVYWLCLCDCGNLTEVRGAALKNEHTKSCGCLNRCSDSKQNNVKHNLSGTRLYNIYRSMKARCYNSKHVHYKDYGGRGIKICQEWLDDNKTFFDWAMNNGYQESLTIDRIGNDKGYSPDNCRWRTMKEQQRNRRDNVYLTYNGETKSIKQWSKDLNVNIRTLYTRKFKKWSVHDILFGRQKQCRHGTMS